MAHKKTATSEKSEKTIRIRQVKSAIATVPGHRDVLRGLGLRRIRHEVVRLDTPAIRGMVNKVAYLVEVIEEPS